METMKVVVFLGHILSLTTSKAPVNNMQLLVALADTETSTSDKGKET